MWRYLQCPHEHHLHPKGCRNLLHPGYATTLCNPAQNWFLCTSMSLSPLNSQQQPLVQNLKQLDCISEPLIFIKNWVVQVLSTTTCKTSGCCILLVKSPCSAFFWKHATLARDGALPIMETCCLCTSSWTSGFDALRFVGDQVCERNRIVKKKKIK